MSNSRGRLRGLVLAAALAVSAAAAVLATPAAPAAANPPGPHDPIGAVSSVKAAPTGGLLVTGWATDPDSLTANHTVSAVLDGRSTILTVTTSLANASVTTKYHTGPTPGFTMTVPVPAGSHTVCFVAHNTGTGLVTLLSCVATPLGTKLTSAQLAAHSPVGAFTAASATATAIHVTGWADDPDYVIRRSVVVLYVDGAPLKTFNTAAYPVPRPTGSGSASKIDTTAAVTPGAHVGCLWVVNVGLGSNSFLGCKAVDTRGTGSAPSSTPAMNTTVMKTALTRRGDAYVWAAAGPKTFDCSGLVLWSYRQAGYTPALPHQSEQQFTIARLIPASHAKPGDLVFFFDTEGDVYHVALYVKPGQAFAAIDEQQGVDYQSIWDPTSVAYGSLTHT